MKITYTVSLFVTALEVDTGFLVNSVILEFDAVVAANGPSLALLIAAWHEMSDASENVLVNITLIARSNHDKVDI